MTTLEAVDFYLESVLAMCLSRTLIFLTFASTSFGALDIVLDYQDPSQFTDEQRAIMDPAFARAELFWESVILGRAGEDDTLRYPIEIRSSSSGLASASALGFVSMGDLTISTNGALFMNPSQVIPSTDGFGIAPGVDVLDELFAHEIGHALGMGSLWLNNSLVEFGSGQYTGEFGLAAFREEFDDEAEFIPVELAGGGASANVHWDQLFRSSSQEGNPADPLSLSPLIGVTDQRGRDLAQDLMSPAIDPDFGEPFFSNTTIQAFRDIGYDVVESFPLTLCDFDDSGLCDATDIDLLSQNIRKSTFIETLDLYGDGQIDDFDRELLLDWHMDVIRGDADLNDEVNFTDFLILSANFGLPGGWAEADFDGSGTVEFADFLILSQSFGLKTAHGVAAVPEPSGLLCTWIGLAIWFTLVRKHAMRR